MRIALYVIGGIVTAIGLLEFMEARGLADIANAGVILICGVVLLCSATILVALESIRRSTDTLPRQHHVGVHAVVQPGQV